jgi:hypothetical protein
MAMVKVKTGFFCHDGIAMNFLPKTRFESRRKESSTQLENHFTRKIAAINFRDAPIGLGTTLVPSVRVAVNNNPDIHARSRLM